MKFITFAFLFTCFSVCSQSKNDSINTIELDEVVVNEYRFSKPKRKISQQLERISKKEIEFQNSQTTADALANSGLVSIQKSQQGGGSPIIRGFESSRILLLVDGVRMNNLIYRSGHLQNIITVDKNMIENIEILFGPSSTIFGSDALGGALYLETKKAKTFTENNRKKLSGSLLSSYSTVNEGKSSHFDFNFAEKKWASLTSFSINEFGDLRMGRNKNGSNDFFGERPFYADTQNGVDVKVQNPNQYVQKFSGYTQYDYMQKIVFEPNKNSTHNLNIQYSTSTDIPRYDRLTDTNAAGNFRSAVWNNGPQNRFLASYKFNKKPVFSNTEMNLIASYQNIEESRITRSFGNPNQTTRLEKVSVYGLTLDLKTKLGKADFVYGLDIYLDNLISDGTVKNIITGIESKTNARYPDGKNNMFRAEAFALYSNDLTQKTTLNTSFRGGYSALNSEMKTNFLNLPFTTIQQQNFTYSGAFGVVHNPTKNTKLVFNVASAFRVPNIDDLSKIFESAPGRVIVPNNNIQPEKTITTDIGFSLWKGKTFQFENTFFYTKLFDVIVTNPFQINGQATILYENQVSTVFANQNQGKGEILGFSSIMKAYLSSNFLIYGNFNYTSGRFDNVNGRYPLDHIPPIYGKVGLKYDYKNWTCDAFVLYNGKKHLEDYSPTGEDNLQYAPANGMPAWQTYNMKTQYGFSPKFTVFSGLENILDTQYRTFSSGINAGGRNFYLGGKFLF